jgi:Ca2+-transporting ATPase
VTVVGAPEVVIAKLSFLNKGGIITPITDQDREFLSEKVVQMSARGLRVLAASYNGQVGSALQEDALPPLTFAGFFGLQDVVRLEVKEAIKLAQKSNIKVVMITGDHRVTAEAIATSVGIFRTGDTVVEGVQLEDLSREELKKIVATATVFARVSPKHKLSIIEAFRARGEVVAMTGDGVNDALSLVAADLGVAMGQIGTEVAKEAADIILLDDNFSSIIAAVEEGRSIYRTIKKTIVYLLSTGIGEMLAIGGAVILGWPLPLLATQIIWLNFVTDGFLVVAFAAEPKDPDILSDSFTNKDASFITIESAGRMFLMGGVMMVGTLFLFSKYINLGTVGDLSNEVLIKAWTISLTTLAVFQWFNVWNCRSDKKSIFTQNPFSNLYLVLATVVVISLHVAIIYLPFLQNIFKTTALSLNEWGLIIMVASSILVTEEIRKLIVRNVKK